MKREVAGPVPFLMSGSCSVRERRVDAHERGRLAHCSHCLCHCGDTWVWRTGRTKSRNRPNEGDQAKANNRKERKQFDGQLARGMVWPFETQF